jgi:hypothetical protein
LVHARVDSSVDRMAVYLAARSAAVWASELAALLEREMACSLAVVSAVYLVDWLVRARVDSSVDRMAVYLAAM